MACSAQAPTRGRADAPHPLRSAAIRSPAHLHFRISHPRSPRLTTQLYLKGESSESGMGGFFSRERDRLEISPVRAPAAREPGALAATYTFVLEAA